MPLHIDLVTPVSLLVLIGGGEFSFGETREIDELLLRSMPSDRRTIAFLPTASGSAEYAGHIGKYFHELDPSVETVNIPIYRGRDARRAKSLGALLSAGMIYLGGGVTNQLLITLRESPADIRHRRRRDLIRYTRPRHAGHRRLRSRPRLVAGHRPGSRLRCRQ